MSSKVKPCDGMITAYRCNARYDECSICKDRSDQEEGMREDEDRGPGTGPRSSELTVEDIGGRRIER